jgi:hypothetical protein
MMRHRRKRLPRAIERADAIVISTIVLCELA